MELHIPNCYVAVALIVLPTVDLSSSIFDKFPFLQFIADKMEFVQSETKQTPYHYTLAQKTNLPSASTFEES